MKKQYKVYKSTSKKYKYHIVSDGRHDSMYAKNLKEVRWLLNAQLEMKIIIYILISILLAFLMYKILSDYQIRIAEHNRTVCAIYGKAEDCKTPLK